MKTVQIFQHFSHHRRIVQAFMTAAAKSLMRKSLTPMAVVRRMAGFLMRRSVDTLICGGIGGGAQAAPGRGGHQALRRCSGDADAALSALLSGNLGYDPNVHCDHHDHAHGEDGHTCGDHGCGNHSCRDMVLAMESRSAHWRRADAQVLGRGDAGATPCRRPRWPRWWVSRRFRLVNSSFT